MIQQTLLWASAGTGFTFLMTTIGAAMVFFMKRQSSALMQQIFLGFASGVMIAASIWSLLIPAIDEAAQNGQPGWIPAAGGFILGLVLMLTLDGLMPHLHSGAEQAEGLPSSFRRTTLLVLAVTLHNIPEGMAVGLSFARAAQHTGNAGLFAAAGALAIGIGIQNFPEGAIISMPLRSEGMNKGKAFLGGMLSGIVEPIGAVLTILAASLIVPALPYFLSYAAGAMLYVVVEELIPEAQLGEHSHAGTLSVMGGFLVMMLLDVLLGT